MLVKRNKKVSPLLIFLGFLFFFIYILNVVSLVDLNNGVFDIKFLNIAVKNIYRINTPLSITNKNIAISGSISFFALMLYEVYKIQNKKNMQENTYGSAEWRNPKDIKDKRDKEFENNIILTQTELISKNMKKSGMNRHVVLLGRPGTRENKILF